MLYTGAGDDGKTKLFHCDQQRISKSSEVPEALGALDELDSFLGLVKVKSDDEIASDVREVQGNIFIMQAAIAGADKMLAKDAVERVEKRIADIEKEIPPVTGFIVPGGTELSALLDVARAIARRAERRLIAAAEGGRAIPDLSRAYLNRLSSLLFALARLANYRANVAEESPKY